MKVIVLGSGIIGITTAYFLARKGYKVSVIDQNPESSRGCSFANGGQLSYSHIETWASKATIFSSIKDALMPNSYLTIKDFGNKEFLKWLFEFYKNSFKKNSQKNSTELAKIASYSQEAMAQILKSENIKFDYAKTGTLHFYRSQRRFKKAIKSLQLEKSLNIKYEILDKEQTIKKEPTLTRLDDQNKLAGSIFFSEDACGNSYKFAKELTQICQDKYGVEFIFNCNVKNILTNHKEITGVNTSQGVLTADKYVYALGAFGDNLLKGINIKSKIYPLKGYSITMPVIEPEFKAPKIALTDCENKIVYSRLGNSFRAAGTVEASGINKFKNQKHINFIRDNVANTFADAGDYSQISSWFGFRPFRPNSLPMICQIKKYPNLYLNTGHGSLGWTLSTGSGKIISEII